VLKSTLPQLLTSATSLISTPSPSERRESLTPRPGAPLAGETGLIPPKYASTTSVNTRPHILSIPSQLLDAPARAAMNLPNGSTAHGQARAVRGNATTPEYEFEPELLGAGKQEEGVPLLSPTPMRPGQNRPALSRSSSAASTSSNRGILRRIFIDRATTPNRHLTHPTFPPPSSSTYSPIPPRPLTFLSKINLFINQSISFVLSTFFLTLVVGWAMGSELSRVLPRWLSSGEAKKFPWDDERYWKKEGRKISKEPRDYARQVGMDIENQTVETEDGYYLRWVYLSFRVTLPP
jgi:lysosomal acid lipase/cholesteryl ester hydrolase